MSLVETALKKMQAAARPISDRSTDAKEAAAPKSGARKANDAAPITGLAPGVIGELVRPGSSRAMEAAELPSTPGISKWIRVDRQALRHQGLLAPEHQERLLANQFRQIKRPLIASAIGRGTTKIPHGQSIMLTSALPGEGKTFTCINLALSMALDKDISVLLMDADVAKPHITRTFGVENEPGLLDVLSDDSLAVESLILPTDVPGLSILPSGRRSETASELVASQRMAETMKVLESNDPHRIVLVDSSPLLLTNEPRSLSRVAGQIVLVVRAGITPQQAVLEAIDHLGEDRAISLVLNQSRTASASYYGYADDEQPPSES